MLLQVENNLARLPSTLFSALSVNTNSGGTVLPVKNINSFTNGWAVQIGQTGEEQAEIVNVSGVPAGTALNTGGTTRFNHAQDTPVYNVHYDSVIFRRSTSGTAGSASPLATVSITPDSFYTEYNDASGIASYAYQTQFYNSVSGDLSGTSSWFIPGGASFYSLQRLRNRIKKNLFSSNYIVDDTTIDEWINEYVEVMTNAALKVNQGYSSGTVQYGFGTAGLGTVTAPLFKYASKIELTTDGITFFNSTEIPVNRFSSGEMFNSVAPRHFWQGDTVFGVLPFGNAGTARFTLGQLSTQLVNDSDELPQFLKGYTTGGVEYGLYRAKSLDQKDAAAQGHWDKFVGYQNVFISEITPRDQTGVKMIDMVEGIEGRNEDLWMEIGY